MSIVLQADPLPLRVDESGTIRIGDSRVTLDVLLRYWRMGMPHEEIARGLEMLSLADVHRALAYYLRHQAEIDDYLQGRDQKAEALRREIETANASRLTSLKARVDAVKAQGNGGNAATLD